MAFSPNKIISDANITINKNVSSVLLNKNINLTKPQPAELLIKSILFTFYYSYLLKFGTGIKIFPFLYV